MYYQLLKQCCMHICTMQGHTIVVVILSSLVFCQNVPRGYSSPLTSKVPSFPGTQTELPPGSSTCLRSLQISVDGVFPRLKIQDHNSGKVLQKRIDKKFQTQRHLFFQNRRKSCVFIFNFFLPISCIHFITHKRLYFKLNMAVLFPGFGKS
jgi:hypothetical protein